MCDIVRLHVWLQPFVVGLSGLSRIGCQNYIQGRFFALEIKEEGKFNGSEIDSNGEVKSKLNEI